MQVIVKARHMKLTDALRQYVDDKLVESVRRIFDTPAVKMEVELIDTAHAKSGETHECRVHMTMPAGKDVIIHEVDDNMYKAIDRSHDRMLLQVKRERERARDGHHRRKHAAHERAETARVNLTAEPELWERETREFEQAAARA